MTGQSNSHSILLIIAAVVVSASVAMLATNMWFHTSEWVPVESTTRIRTPDWTQSYSEEDAEYERLMREFAEEESQTDTALADASELVGGTDDASFSIVAWNVESGGNDPAVIAERLDGFWFEDEVVCLSEVNPKNSFTYGESLQGYFGLTSRSGGGDRLMIFASPKLELLEQGELDEINDGRHRAPIFMRLRHRALDLRFIVLTVHLARGNAEFRTEQARRLVEWARNETDPIIAIGDFNLDYDFATEQGNDAFVEILRDGIFEWVKPDPLIDTNWSDRDGDGEDDYPDSMLDFAFVANGATEWDVECEVIVTDGDFPDNERTSDHRPVRLVVAGTD